MAKKKWARILSFTSAGLIALTLFRPKGKYSARFLGTTKLLAGGLSPFLAAAGGLGALLGLARRDRKAMWAGLVGSALAVRHITQVTAPHDGFTRAFGAGWQTRIPQDLQTRMLSRRYEPIISDPPTVPWQQDVVVGTHAETGDPLLADLWQPPDSVPRTGLGIIYLHGSAWHYLDKDAGTRRFFQHLAGQGHVVLDLAYTLAPKAQLQAMVADVKRAIAWVKTNAANYSVNPERVVLIGGSAGAHLAMLAAYAPHHPQLQPADVEMDTSVRAVISYYGPPDLQVSYNAFGQPNAGHLGMDNSEVGARSRPTLERFLHRVRFLPPYGKITALRDILPNLFGGTPDEVPEMYALGSPINHVGPHCPPTLLLQGAHDVFGMTPDVRRLHQALCEAGTTSIHVEFPDTDHAFDLFLPKWSPAAQAALYDTERFLALMI